MRRVVARCSRAALALLMLSLVSLGAASCGAPPVFPTQDRQQNLVAGRIEGSVVVTGRARGNVILFLFDAQRPPPPEGSGRPVTFTFIPRETLFGPNGQDSAGSGPFVAPFTFSLVPPGQYLIRGFIDADDCASGAALCRPSDFIPWFGVTGEPNAGDVGGAAVDAATLAPRQLVLTEASPILSRVQVSFSEASTVPADRPSFRVVAGAGVLGASGAVMELAAERLETGAIHQGRAVFLVRHVDANGDGIPDDADGDGVADLWPKVFVRKLEDEDRLLAEENDTDGDGLLDAGGVEYPRAEGPIDGRPDRVFLQAAIEAPGVTPSLTPTPTTQLRVNIRPLALDLSDPAAPGRLAQVPPGRYALILMQFTGQTWRVPNELHPLLAPALGLPPAESQAFTFQVP